MPPAPVSIACKKCHQVFAPDVKTKKAWRCGFCNAKNPNLRRHYRSVADLMILGLLVTVILGAVIATTNGLNLGVLLLSLHSLLLTSAIVVIYRAATPWTDHTANILMWAVFGIAFAVNVVLPFLMYRRAGPVLVYVLIFSYLLWLKRAVAKAVPPLSA